MRKQLMRLAASVVVCWGLMLGGAFGQPGQGPRETVNQNFTTKRPNTPTGLRFSAEYHAPGDKEGAPPYLRRIVFFPPGGVRYNTNVPAKCTASDAVLEAQGPDACPPKSLIGHGTASGLFMFPVANDVEFHNFFHHTVVINNTNEQILLVHSEGYTVVRGRIRRDGAVVYDTPACFPAPPGGCVDEYIIQLKTTTNLPRISRRVKGRKRVYARTPRHCPRRGWWRTVVRFVWEDGAVDSVPTRQPCRRN